MNRGNLGVIFLIIGFAILYRVTDLNYALAMTSLVVGLGLMVDGER